MLKFAIVVLLAGICGYAVLSDSNRGAYDFQAFYCAGAAARAHANPYLTQPLGACEHRQTDGTYAALPADVVLPAPQPGYDVAAFAALSALPFDRAKAVWGAILAMAIAVAIACVVGATRLPLTTVLAAFLAALVFPAFAFGELFALFAAAACAAMFFAARGKWAAAGIAAALSLVEPHLGLPLCLALAFWRPRTCAALGVTIALLVAVSAGTLGVRASLEYATLVLPLHAFAEISSDAQLSLSAVLHAAGIADTLAVQIGVLSYLASCLFGIRLGEMLAARWRDDAFLVAVPAAFATIGGTFIHVTELFAAIPLALLLAARDGRYRGLATCALVLLAVPWFTALEPGNALALAALGAIVTSYLVWRGENARMSAALAACALAFAVLFAAPRFAGDRTPHTPAPARITATAYPQESWQAWNYRALSTGSTVVWLLRGLSWTGLTLLAAAAALSRRDEAWSPAPAQSTPSAR